MIKRLLLLIMAVQAKKRNKTRIGRQQEKESVLNLKTMKKNLQLSINETHKVTHFTGYNKSIGLTARR